MTDRYEESIRPLSDAYLNALCGAPVSHGMISAAGQIAANQHVIFGDLSRAQKEQRTICEFQEKYSPGSQFSCENLIELDEFEGALALDMPPAWRKSAIAAKTWADRIPVSKALQRHAANNTLVNISLKVIDNPRTKLQSSSHKVRLLDSHFDRPTQYSLRGISEANLLGFDLEADIFYDEGLKLVAQIYYAPPRQLDLADGRGYFRCVRQPILVENC